MKNTYLHIFLLASLGGIFLNNILQAPIFSFFIALFGCVLLCNIWLYIRQYRHTIIPFIIGVSLWIFISSWTLNSTQENISFLTEKTFSSQNIEIVIEDVYKKSEDGVDYVWRVTALDDIALEDQNIRTLVRIPSNFVLVIWDKIRYTSKIYMIENFDRFEYQNFMLSKNIYFRSYGSTFIRLWEWYVPEIFIIFFHFREYLLSILSELYPKEEKIFLGWILLWAREDIPDDLKTAFNNSGLTHFIAVSGFNITLLVIFFWYIFRYFPVWLRTISIIVSIILFTILVGFSAPVIRAAIMGILWYLVLASGRTPKSLTIVLITAFFMVLISPLTLNYDVSFHLSFLAVIWIIYTQWFFKKVFGFLPEFFAIREAFVLTLAALSFTLPIMVFNFWQVSLFAPFANIAVTWTIPIAMFFGFLSLIGYIIYAPSGYFIWYIDWVFLKYDIMMVYFFWGLDFAILELDFGLYSLYIEVVYFLVLTFFIIYFQTKEVA